MGEEIFQYGKLHLILEKNLADLYFRVTDLECLQTADSWYIKLKHVLDIHLRALESGLLLKVNVYV